MRLPIRERAFTIVIVILATIVVIVLGVLQYRWGNEVSEATSIRLADSLQMSMINWHLDFFRDFSEICVAMRVDPDIGTHADWNQYVLKFAEWKRTTAYPNLVSSAYVLTFDNGSAAKVLRLDPAGYGVESVTTLSPSIAELRQELRAAPVQSALSSPASDQSLERDFADRFYPGGPLAGWQFESRVPALVRPINRGAFPPGSANPGGTEWLVIALNEKNIQARILPDLSQQYFIGTEGHLDYEIAVVAGTNPERVIYSSDAGFGEQQVPDADGALNIFGRLQDKRVGSPIYIFHAPSENKGLAASVGVTWFPLFHPENDEDWHLILRHRRGGALGAFVADSRRRDMAISFGVLFLLVVSIAILIITSARAQRLAHLQMDFVAAVSHELRTPLTVISSAADNIAHGVVGGKQQLEQYGTVIGAQVSKLLEMVEQILLFAAIREGHQRYSLRTLDVTEIMDAALSSTSGLIHTAGFQVDRKVEPNLPLIHGDLSALSRCLQNLITNALKYGGEQKWMSVEARFTEHGLTGKEIQIRVSDHGIGIDAQELTHIFEPFYRSSSVTDAQIHGTGLGLPLAKSIVEAMKGQISVKSVPGRGSTFTLHLPCLEHFAREAEAKAVQTVSS